MGGLREKLAGLERFRETDVLPPEPFDCRRAEQMMQSVLSRVVQIYLPGSLDRARAYKPELATAVCRALIEVDNAYLAKDMPRLRTALGAFGKSVRDLVAEFGESDPAGEVPLSLFPEDDAARKRAVSHREAL